MSTPTIMAPKSKRPAMPIMRECDHCGGEGEVEVYCDDCGNDLDTDSVAKDEQGGELDVCKECHAERSARPAKTMQSAFDEELARAEYQESSGKYEESE